MRTTSKTRAHSRCLCCLPSINLWTVVGIITSSLRQAWIKISSSGSGQSLALSWLSSGVQKSYGTFKLPLNFVYFCVVARWLGLFQRNTKQHSEMVSAWRSVKCSTTTPLQQKDCNYNHELQMFLHLRLITSQ